VDLVQLSYDGVQWPAVVNTAMKTGIPEKVRNFLNRLFNYQLHQNRSVSTQELSVTNFLSHTTQSLKTKLLTTSVLQLGKSHRLAWPIASLLRNL
jgi:hypothetical protein